MKKELALQEVAKVVNEIIAFDDTHHIQSVELEGIQRVSVGYGGEIVEIDNNNMVLLEFEDYIGTTDWLPLGIFEESVISHLLFKLVTIKVEMEEKHKHIVYAMAVEDSRTTKTVHKVFHKLDDAQAELLRLYDEYKANPKRKNMSISYWQGLYVQFNDGHEINYFIHKTTID